MTFTRASFDGTGASAAHIGDAAATGLANALNDVGTETTDEATQTTAISTAQTAADLANSKLALMVSGSVTIAIGQDTQTVALAAGLNGKPAFAMIQQAADDGTLTFIKRVSWNGSGVLSIVGNANATAAVTVKYFVDGR